MEISEKDILDKTQYGLDIYAHILRKYYPGEVVISLSGKRCKPARNPFKDGRATLKVYLKDGAFVYEDENDTSFSGNPFSFAALHYQYTGNELLTVLNEEMFLNIGRDHSFYGNKNAVLDNDQEEVPPLTIPEFSFFKCPVSNTVPAGIMNLVEVCQVIKSNDYRQQTETLRSIRDKKQAREFKAKHFDYVTFSGTFTKRSDQDLQNHSGLLTIDFDHIKDLPKLKDALLRDDYFETNLMFISPSGDGLKWIISIDLQKANHQEYFRAVSNYILKTYNLEVDKSGKDISRACFLPYDRDVFINPDYLQL